MEMKVEKSGGNYDTYDLIVNGEGWTACPNEEIADLIAAAVNRDEAVKGLIERWFDNPGDMVVFHGSLLELYDKPCVVGDLKPGDKLKCGDTHYVKPCSISADLTMNNNQRVVLYNKRYNLISTLDIDTPCELIKDETE